MKRLRDEVEAAFAAAAFAEESEAETARQILARCEPLPRRGKATRR